ncbi:MAG TPA: dienelactone hydrolase [Opitutae bacterium]|nr:dienelactone hydrolase [Opitutae bacterium]
MKQLALLFLSVLGSASLASADFIQKTIPYELEGVHFEGTLIYDQAATNSQPLPGIVMIPNWMGPTENAFEKARMVARDNFAVFVADMYSVNVRPSNSSEAGKTAGTLRSDRSMMRARAQKAVDVFHALAQEHPINPDNTIAIGFCFGGGTVLELARSGTESVQGVVSFHGDLKSPTLESDADQIKIPLLVLHGADDPYVPQADVAAFTAAMQAGEVDDWTLVQFSGAVHSFTNPDANSDGSRYHPRTSQRAFEMLDHFADALWTTK